MNGTFQLKPVLAEGIGTFIFVFVGAGAIITQNLIGTNDLLSIALAHGIILSIVISIFGSISGGHINPAVTIGLLVGRQIKLGLAVFYIVAQLIGAVVAGLLLLASFPADASKPVYLGTPPLYDVTLSTAVLIEAVLTFFLVLAVYGTVVDPKAPKIGGFGIGLTLMSAILVGGPLTGASLNPARTFGPALASGYWSSFPAHLIGPIIGGLIAGIIYSNVFLRKEA